MAMSDEREPTPDALAIVDECPVMQAASSKQRAALALAIDALAEESARRAWYAARRAAVRVCLEYGDTAAANLLAVEKRLSRREWAGARGAATILAAKILSIPDPDFYL